MITPMTTTPSQMVKDHCRGELLKTHMLYQANKDNVMMDADFIIHSLTKIYRLDVEVSEHFKAALILHYHIVTA